MRYEGPATIRQKEQEIRVDCVVTVRQPSKGRANWSGRFTRAERRLLATRAVLVLPGGESGRIMIEDLESTGDSGTFVGRQAPLLAGAIRS